MILETVDLEEFGLDISAEDFGDEMAEDFNCFFRGQESIHELLSAPRFAHQFCEHVRRSRGYYDVPDDVILQCILDRDEFEPEDIVLAVPSFNMPTPTCVLVPMG